MQYRSPSPELLAAFTEAWNHHDSELLMTFMTEDCIFDTSAGPLIHGNRFEGFDSVKAAYESIWSTFPDAHWFDDHHFIVGERGISEWTFRGTTLDGKAVEMRGCDLFLFKNGKIHIKDSFRKYRT